MQNLAELLDDGYLGELSSDLRGNLTKKIWSLVLSGKRLIQKVWISLVSSMKSVLSRLN